MPHVPIPELPSYTQIFYLGWAIYLRGWEIRRKGEELANIWLIGVHLSAFIIGIGQFLMDRMDTFREIDLLIRNLKVWIDGLTEGDIFEKFLDWLSNEYKLLRQNPSNWVAEKLRIISIDAWILIYWPLQWFRDKLRNSSWWFGNFLDDPRSFVISKIREIAWWLDTFLIDPASKVREWIISKFPFLDTIKFNPFGWIINLLDLNIPWFYMFRTNPVFFMRERLGSYRAALFVLLDNPELYIQTVIANFLGIPFGALYQLSLSVLEQFMDNFLSYRYRIQNRLEITICEIIMWFM